MGRVFRQAASIGALQLHLSGGEPTIRRDLEEILAHAVDAGLYTNLVTSAVLLTRERLAHLAEIGLDHVQVSVQDVVPESSDHISGFEGGVAKKRDVARWAREFGLGLTINAPIHRQNIDHLPQIIDFAVEVGAQRLEVAHIQYYAWAELNRAALIPTREKFLETVGIVEEAKKRLQGVLNFDFVIHDHYASRPKACTGGWGRSIMVVTPSGKALPCHAAQTLPGLSFDNVRERPLADIWRNGAAFEAFRGEEWMQEPCRSCDKRGVDYGGCRCQALAVTGDAAATDPACHRSAHHAGIRGARRKTSRCCRLRLSSIAASAGRTARRRRWTNSRPEPRQTSTRSRRFSIRSRRNSMRSMRLDKDAPCCSRIPNRVLISRLSSWSASSRSFRRRR